MQVPATMEKAGGKGRRQLLLIKKKRKNIHKAVTPTYSGALSSINDGLGALSTLIGFQGFPESGTAKVTSALSTSPYHFKPLNRLLTLEALSQKCTRHQIRIGFATLYFSAPQAKGSLLTEESGDACCHTGPLRPSRRLGSGDAQSLPWHWEEEIWEGGGRWGEAPARCRAARC